MKRILCFGDSLTWGFKPGTGERFDENTRWTSILQKNLGNEYKVEEDGISGRTTVYSLGRNEYQCGRIGLGYALCANAPLDLVIIMLGTNDLEYASVESIAVGMDELVRTTLNSNYIYRVPSPIFKNEPKVLIICPPLINEKIDELNPDNSVFGKASFMKKLPKLYENVAKNRNVYFLDSNKYIKVSLKDCVHIDEENHKILANVLADKIKEII